MFFTWAGRISVPVITPSGVLAEYRKSRGGLPASYPGKGTARRSGSLPRRFVNIIARALVALGERPDYAKILRYVTNIGELYQTYSMQVIKAQLPDLFAQIENAQNALTVEDVPRHLQSDPKAVAIWATELALSSEKGKKIYDPIFGRAAQCDPL